MQIPTVDRARLRLRAWSEDDREPFAAMNADPEVMRYMSRRLDRAASDALVDRIIEDWATNGFGLWAIERRSDGRFLGFAGLWRPRFEAPFMPAVEVGWRLARDAWGFGYATEAGTGCRDYGFATLGLRRIAAVIQHGNDRSFAVARRLGMRPERDIRTANGFKAQLWVVAPDQ